MAHPEDLEKLIQGAKVWNAWRQEDPDHIPDLRDAELSMSQRQFGAGNGGPINLSDADLQGMVLRHSTLTDASLIRANLVATDLVQSRLDGADLTGADLTDAVLDYTDLTGANLNGAILVGASLVNVTGLTQEQISQAHGDSSTALPAYLLPPESWFPALEGSIFDEYDSHLDLSPLSDDPYEVLGVEQNATFDEIRASFRTLVKRLHPDLNPDDPIAQERFKRVSIAYRILGDPVKRDRYNRGEIDADGDVRPEFEANKEFRRYAFKFYMAAAASLILAIGILGSVWYSWMQDGESNGGARTAEAGPPKLIERLTAPTPEPEAKQQVAATTPQDEKPAVAPTQIAAIATAVQDGATLDIASSSESAEAQSTHAATSETIITIPEGAMESELGQTEILASNTKDTDSAAAIQESAETAPAEQITVSSTDAEMAATGLSPATPIQATARQLNPVKPALDDGNLRESVGQKFANLDPSEAVEVSQTLSSATSDTASVIDQNNKLSTLIKDIKTLVRSEPLSMSSYQPQWQSVHSVVLKSRSNTSIENDGISKVFRNRTMSRLRNIGMTRTATDADSLQIPRNEQTESVLTEFNLDFVAPDAGDQELPKILINPDIAAAELLLQPAKEEKTIVDTAALEAKTADRGTPPSVTQTRY